MNKLGRRNKFMVVLLKTIKDMYDKVIMTMQTTRDSKQFPISIGWHQGTTLNPYLSVVVMDEITRHIHEKV